MLRDLGDYRKKERKSQGVTDWDFVSQRSSAMWWYHGFLSTPTGSVFPINAELCCHWRVNSRIFLQGREQVLIHSEQSWQAEHNAEHKFPSPPQPLSCPSTCDGVARSKHKAASKETLCVCQKAHLPHLSKFIHRESYPKKKKKTQVLTTLEPEDTKLRRLVSRTQAYFTKALKSGNHAVRFLLFFMNTLPTLSIHALGDFTFMWVFA